MEPGRRLDRYLVSRLLGRGGMADVWLAEHEVLRTRVAIKVLRGAPGGSVRERLLREGRVQAALQHPNVVRVLDVIEVDGCAALVMDVVDGLTLQDVLADGPVPLARVDRLLVGIVAGLEAAHALQIVHRDLKPANVLVTPDDTPRITDFGLAAVLDEVRLTRQGVGVGTPHYMAPEQVEDARKVDRRADVFSLGVLAYELVVGQPPADGPPLAVVHRMGTGRWDLPSTRIAGLPERVDLAIRKALAPSPADRTPSVTRFLEDFLGESPSARRTPQPAPPAVATPSRPSTIRALLGRDEDVATLDARVSARGGLVSVVGPPGVGKTRLAAEVLARWADARGPKAGVWVDLSPVDRTDLAEARIAAALDLPEGRPLGPEIARRGAFLLVLDNLEHLPDVGATIDALADGAPSARLLTTSREPLRLAREEVHVVRPLPIDEGDPCASAAFRILRAAAPAGVLDRVSDDVVRRLLTALDGLPLCLQLAGARLEILGPDELAARLESPTRVLRVPGSGDRHDALSETLRWSWSLLGEPEQIALSWVSVWRGPFLATDAEAQLAGVVEEPLDALHGLVRRNLIAREGPRLRLLRAIRDFADRALAHPTAARRAHAAVVAAQSQKLHDLDAEVRVPGLRALAPELEAVLAAEGPSDEHVVAATSALTSLYHDTGPARSQLRVARLGLTRAPPDHPARYGLELSRALALRRAGDLVGAATSIEAARAIARTDRELAITWIHQADLLLEQHRDDEARELYLRALDVVRVTGPNHAVVTVSAALATIAKDIDLANRWLAEGEAALTGRDPISRLRWAKSAGWVALYYGQLDAAHARYTEVRTLAAEFGDRRTEGYAIGQLATVEEQAGRAVEAQRGFAFAAERYLEEGDTAYAGYFRGCEGRAHALLGAWEAAITAFEIGAATAPSPYVAEFEAFARMIRSRATDRWAELDPRWQWLVDGWSAERAGDQAQIREALSRRPARSTDIVVERLLDHLAKGLADASVAWRIAPDGSAFQPPEGEVVSLQKHPANSRILARLLSARDQGEAIDAADLAAAGWPGERIVASAAANRVRVALSALRRAGLESLIERCAGGWRLDPAQPVTGLGS